MRKLISFLLLSFVAYTLQAQIKDPVKFKTELNSLSDTEAEIMFILPILETEDLFLPHLMWRRSPV